LAAFCHANALFHRVSTPFTGTIFREHRHGKQATTPPKVFGRKAKELLAETPIPELRHARLLLTLAQ